MEWTCRRERYYHNGWIVEPSEEGWIIKRPKYKELGGEPERVDKMTYTNSVLAMIAAERMMSMKKPETEDDEWELV